MIIKKPIFWDKKRPDLLSNNKYGTVDYWWVFSVRNVFVVIDSMYSSEHGNIKLDIPGGLTTETIDQGKLFFDEWTHFAIVRDQNLLHTVYRNGEAVGSLQGNSLEFTLNPSPSIGECGYGDNCGGSPYGSGNLDEVRFWNYARTPEQIQQNF